VVASSLLAVCNDGSYDVLALPDGTHYSGPTSTGFNPCQCSTVSYSLMSACGLCQNRTIAMWSSWSLNCPTVYVDSFPEPIPSGVSVPGWAYLDVELHDVFNQSLAMQNANITESTAVPQPTSTPSTTSSTTSATSTSSQTSPTAAPASNGSSPLPDLSHSNAVGGGAVGGIFGAVVIGGLLFWCLRRRRRVTPSDLNVPAHTPVVTEQKDTSHHLISALPSITVSELDANASENAIRSVV